MGAPVDREEIDGVDIAALENEIKTRLDHLVDVERLRRQTRHGHQACTRPGSPPPSTRPFRSTLLT